MPIRTKDDGPDRGAHRTSTISSKAASDMPLNAFPRLSVRTRATFPRQSKAKCKIPRTVGLRKGGVASTKPLPTNARFPTSWTGPLSMPSRQEVSDELRDEAQKLMDGTWKDCITRDRYTCGTGDTAVMKYEVVQVLRNQNPHTWCDYVRKRAAIRADLKMKPDAFEKYTPKTSPFVSKFSQEDHPLYAADNEMFLFHGTKPSAADAICDSDFLLSGAGALFGPGVYFSEMSSKSDEYVVDDIDGIYQGLYATLLCRVMIGRVKYNDMKKPDGDACAASCVSREYNGVVGDREKVRGTYREFVVYEPKQAYPEFVIIYRRTKGSSPAEQAASPAKIDGPKPPAKPSTCPGKNFEPSKKPSTQPRVRTVTMDAGTPHRVAKATTTASPKKCKKPTHVASKPRRTSTVKVRNAKKK